MKCMKCHNTLHSETGEFSMTINGKSIKVINAPVLHCKNCNSVIISDEVKEKAKEPVEPLTDAEQHAMNSYISSSSYVWNDKLRRGEKLTKQEEQSIKAMDSALQKMPKYEGTVKRSLSDFGIPDVDEFVKSYVPGELKIFNEYLSSSTEVYDDSFQIQYVIRSKNGRDIRKYNSTEKEILFERGASFIVTRVDGHTIYMEEL